MINVEDRAVSDGKEENRIIMRWGSDRGTHRKGLKLFNILSVYFPFLLRFYFRRLFVSCRVFSFWPSRYYKANSLVSVTTRATYRKYLIHTHTCVSHLFLYSAFVSFAS